MHKSLVDIASAIEQRMRSRFLASIIISLVVFNYRALVILLTTEPYWVKFNYLDSQYGRFEDKIHWFGIPIAAALTYTLVWPLIDAKFRELEIWQHNRTALGILRQERKEPLDAKQQAAYFASVDAELEQHKAHVSSIYAREGKRINSLIGQIKPLEGRLLKQVSRRLAEECGLSASALMTWFAHVQRLTSRLQDIPEVSRIQEHRTFKLFPPLSKWLETMPVDESDGRISATTQSISEALRVSEEAAEDLQEALIVVNLARFSDGHFRIENPGNALVALKFRLNHIQEPE